MARTIYHRWQAQEKRPQGVKKRPQPLRRSPRLQEARRGSGAKRFLPSPPTTNPLEPKALHHSPPPGSELVSPSCPAPELQASQGLERKRKRSQEVEASHNEAQQKCLWPDTNDNRPPADINGNQLAAEINDDQRSANISDNRNRRVTTWLRKGSYPEAYFEASEQTWENIKADTSARRQKLNDMNRLFARKKSNASLRNEGADIEAPTEKTEDEGLPYRSPGYEQELKDQKSHLRESPEGVTDDDKRLCQKLLNKVQTIPQDSLFRDELFEQTCDKIRTRNESRVVEDISPLIAPSAETLTTYGATELHNLVFGVNEPWSESIPITKTRPQSDRYAAYSRDAFTESQIQRLLPMIGNRVPINFHSFVLATWRSFFPFFTCEAKGGVGDLDVADKQNAHSMTMAVRGIVELFKLVNRENEVHRKLLAFSISHDARYVRIYGHYALIEDRVATFWRHCIHTYDITAQDGREKWTAYRFTKNVYFEFSPHLHKLICSAIDQIPLSATPQYSVLSHQIPPNASFGADTDLDSEQPDSQDIAASAPESQSLGSFKKPRLSANAVLRQQVEELKQQLSERDGTDSDVLIMLRQELDRLRQEKERDREEHRREKEEHRREMEELREEHKRENEEHKRGMEELRDLLRQSLLAQPK